MKRVNLTAWSARLLGGAALTALCAGAAAAQDEIIVSAQKREQTLQQVPIAVSVVGADSIEKSQAADLTEIQVLVPTLRVSTLQNSSQTNFIIRGFGNGANNPGIESSVGVFIDGVYRSRSAAAILDLPVLERVEVLHGPQSTLFGKNVSAGAISITTKKPEFEWGGFVEAGFGSLEEAIFRGTLTGPISDNLAFRISGSTNNRNGFYTNEVDGSRLNGRDRWAIRGDLLWEASDVLSFKLAGDWNQIDEVCCGVIQLLNGPATLAIAAPPPFGLGLAIDPAGDTDYSVALDEQVFNTLRGRGLSLHADWDLGGAVASSITAYREQTDNSQTDADFSAASIATNPQRREFRTFTQEIRLASAGDNEFDWLVGGFFFDEEVLSERDVIFGSDARAFFDILAAGAGVAGALSAGEAAFGLPVGTTFFGEGTGVFGDYRLDNRTFSIFAQIDWHITDRLTLSGGGAYINDRKETVGNSLLTDLFSGLEVGRILGFQNAFTQLTDGVVPPAGDGVGLPATPGNAALPFNSALVAPAFFANMAAPTTLGAAATLISTTGCSQNPALLCNPALALQLFPEQVNFPDPNNPLDNGLLQDDQFTYMGRLAYDFTDNINAYFSYSTGWKAGAVNLSSDSTPPDPITGLGRTAGPEEVTLFEFGIKTQFPGGYINVAFFDQTIDGFQSNLFVGTGFVLANAGEQSVRGFEIDSVYSPWDPLRLNFGVTYLDPEYDSFTQAPCVSFVGITPAPAACLAGATTFDASGERPAGIAPLTLTAGATYTRQLTDDLDAYVHGEFRYESEAQVIENVAAAIASREVQQLNVSIGFDWENGFGLQGFVRNALDDQYLQSAFPSVAQAGSFSGYLNEPRTWGIAVRKRF